MKKCSLFLLTVIFLNIFSPTALALESAMSNKSNLTTSDFQSTPSSSYVRVVDSHNLAITNEDGVVSKVYIDDEHNVFVDGVLELTSDEFDGMVQVSKNEDQSTEQAIMARSAITWYYLDTHTYNIDFQNRGRTVLLGVIAFLIPYLTPAIGIGSILDALLGEGAPGMYVKLSRYYRNGYQFYKYCYHFYSDEAMRYEVAYREEIKRMW